MVAPVGIENQLERSNHDHLGKLLTYLAAYEASTAIWIVAEPRAEHVKAVAWLNDSSQANVYLLKVEAVRIGDSTPAPLLTKLVGPSPEAVTSQPQSRSAASAMSCGGDSGRNSWPAPSSAPGCTRPSARAPAPT
jgi:hypothetical protein